ncbi:MAG: 16S rRNA (cytosine(1402)-N(4))-methyltransferase RsmH [Firmicutes bacterium]|nr:16S rRNA (cytosine(1402)-N(4))-methyltransferase RsmH [Bacillota bacterium]
MEYYHKPVLLKEVLEILQPAGKTTIVDCTVGGGGHALALRRLLPPRGWLIGIDQDEDALQAAEKRLAGWDNVRLLKGNFSQLRQLLSQWELPIDGFLFDLGVSSWQLDNPERGFSYQHNAPLDMRMDQSRSLTAKAIINTWPQRELAFIFRAYGEEKWASRIAQFIVRQRESAPIETTGRLVEIIKAAIPAAARREGGHPGRRVFQALRIAVNSELDSLRQGLTAAMDLCAPGGVVAVISYHSLEDRIVKQLMRDRARECICPPEAPVCRCDCSPQVKILTRKPVAPSAEEIRENPRSRSAKLRACAVLKQFGGE